jgi:hypothetical protein
MLYLSTQGICRGLMLAVVEDIFPAQPHGRASFSAPGWLIFCQ